MKKNEQQETPKKDGLLKRAAIGVAKVAGDILDRTVPQGASEVANALFNGNAYHQYQGEFQPGQAVQWPKAAEKEAEKEAQPAAADKGVHGMDGEVMPPVQSAAPEQNPQINQTVDVEPQTRWNPSEYAALPPAQDIGIENQGMGH